MNYQRILFACILLLAAPDLGGARAPGEYPKLLAHSRAMGDLPAAVRDTIARYELVVCQDRPETIAELRQRNPGQRYLWEIMPQYVAPCDSLGAPWWMADTLWSMPRLIQYYALKNNWYLYDTSGVPMEGWGGLRYINWTQYCPVGTFGSSKGLRASQWIASVALPAIALSNRYWDTWSWDSHTAYNGIMFEILADCLGSYGNLDVLSRADPNRDGIAEGVSHTCASGGDTEPLSILYREENEDFYARLSAAFPVDFVFVINENNSKTGPWWRTKLSGQKLENWMLGPSWTDWWDYFYGLTPPWLPGENWGAGYAWIEGAFDKPVDDAMKGWDLSYILIHWDYQQSNEANLQRMRYGLGTSLLGDGYFAFYKDDRHPLWPPEFDWNLGTPIADFSRELYGGDTLYVRQFTRGMAEVNPYPTAVNGVPPADSRFTFWLPVSDLHADPTGSTSIRATFTAPHGTQNEADFYELRYATFPISVENWDTATSYNGNPIAVPPGTPVTATLQGLAPGTSYSVSVRTHTRGRPEPVLSNDAGATTVPPPDSIPPEPIPDVHAVGGSQTWIDLAWTAPGDDGTFGTATRYELRYLQNSVIDTEPKWNQATPASNLPNPHVAGSPEAYRLTGLSAGHTYGICVRAVDEAGNIASFSNAFSARTSNPPPPPGDQVPPAAITDLSGVPAGQGRMCLLWTAPGDDGWTGRATTYEVRILAGESITTEGQWSAATIPAEVPPYPGFPHSPQTFVISNLKPGELFGVAVRTSDEAGNLSLLSNSPIVQAGDEDSNPPPMDDGSPPSGVEDLNATVMGDTSAVLQWTATGDDGDVGSATRYALRILPGRRISTEEEWNLAQGVTGLVLPDPAPAGTPQSCVIDRLPQGTYGASLRAIDEAENIGPLGASVLFRIGPPDLAPPETVSGLRVSGPDDEGKIAFRWDPSSAADLAGYNIYGSRGGAGWTLVNSALIPAGVTSVTLLSDGEEFYVTAVDTSGNESAPGAVVRLAMGSVILAGPFPHPVREGCRFEIYTPRSFSPARVTLVLRDVQGRTIREIYSGTAGPLETISIQWDRRDDTGRVAAPGFYVAVLRAGDARVLRRVFLSP